LKITTAQGNEPKSNYFYPGTLLPATISLLAFGFQRSRQKPIKNYAPQANDANEEAKPKKKIIKTETKKNYTQSSRVEQLLCKGADRKGPRRHGPRFRSRSSILGPLGRANKLCRAGSGLVIKHSRCTRSAYHDRTQRDRGETGRTHWTVPSPDTEKNVEWKNSYKTHFST